MMDNTEEKVILPRDILTDFRLTHPPETASIGGRQWEYIACGKGEKTLLILNGGLRIAETAFAYIELFEPYYRVIVPTYPPIWSIDELTNGIINILDMKGEQEVLALGQSYGGMVAQVLVQRFPQRISKLVISGAGPLVAPIIQRVILNLLLALIPILPEKTVKSIYKNSLRRVISIPEESQSFWRSYLDEIFNKRLSKGDVLSHFRTGADTLKKYAFGMNEPWTGNVLVIGGEKDPVSTDGDRKAILEYYPHVKLKVIQGAGHTIAMQKPGEFFECIQKFLCGS